MALWNHTCTITRLGAATQSEAGAVTPGATATVYQGACNYQGLMVQVRHELADAGVQADGALWLPIGVQVQPGDSITVTGVGEGQITSTEAIHRKHLVRLSGGGA